ncbi:sigma-70 family RNA polymerase sigma factor [Haliangium ochraceum]|uniref:RNA polymerase, sigma-24 subunit, ECF subfamily n=1 Tax=Haliangium ochraceum (strain DSM 14365 / JCM 11303 / SMP-2) TaxID=502025 RepID=D0LXD4_HALO1|nr:sigma-70 family RNA polymerase sigma factor [Haliangium ochraceum]ACY16176.1 RNA polymerase, sigma-24 subunit, ECF subfamily [Haliangium ochraceum DSM 14365]
MNATAPSTAPCLASGMALRPAATRDRDPGGAQQRQRRAAFTRHCLPHRGELYAVALRMTRSPADANDLVQETFLRAYAAWSGFEPGSNCRAWLFRIQTNSYINLYRKRRRHHRIATAHPEDTRAAAHPRDAAHAASPEEVLLADALGDEVTRALGKLRPDYREVVELADVRGLGYREIADELSLPLGTVMSRLFRARRSLEGELRAFAANDYGIDSRRQRRGRAAT